MAAVKKNVIVASRSASRPRLMVYPSNAMKTAASTAAVRPKSVRAMAYTTTMVSALNPAARLRAARSLGPVTR